MIHTIDLHFQGRPGAIASFLVNTDAGLALIECGPASTLPALQSGLRALGHALGDVRHLFLSHIHFDHAGAAWRLAQLGAQIHVHPFGAPHLQDPEVLWKSAKRIYQDCMETLWGEMHPIADQHLHAVDDQALITLGKTTFIAHHTPGHAKHHIAWQLDKDLFTGDVAGVRIGHGPVQPPCPPPDIDVEAWKASIDRIRALNVDTLYLTHFGAVTDIAAHLDELDATLDQWARWIQARLADGLLADEIIPEFEAFVKQALSQRGLSEDQLVDYEAVNPAFMSVGGLSRYWTKRS